MKRIICFLAALAMLSGPALAQESRCYYFHTAVDTALENGFVLEKVLYFDPLENPILMFKNETFGEWLIYELMPDTSVCLQE